MKGQISILTAIIGSIGLIGANLAAGYFTVNNRISDIRFETEQKISEIKQITNEVKTTEELHYKELKEKIDKMDKKLDTLIEIQYSNK